MSEANPAFSLARAGANNIALNIGALIVVVVAVLCGAYYLNARHDSEMARLQAQQHAELITQKLSLLGRLLQDRSMRRDAESALAEGTQTALSEWARQQLQYLPQAAALVLVPDAGSSSGAPGPGECSPADGLRQAISNDLPVRWFSNDPERFNALIPVVSRVD
ncbi:MAG: hypothetical protein GTO41_24015, partial [Burkholderiales bacterium]|nr:hypothetical protein [Burkholderiales bacterium]